LRNNEIHAAVRQLKKAVRAWRVPVVGDYTATPFTVLISCLLSLRTQDKTTDAASARLFALAKTPAAMSRLSVPALQKAIYPVSFYRVKARRIKEICRMILNDLLVAYGQNLCRPLSPHCSRCGLASICARNGVTVAR